jgi:hypothetical protein
VNSLLTVRSSEGRWAAANKLGRAAVTNSTVALARRRSDRKPRGPAEAARLGVSGAVEPQPEKTFRPQGSKLNARCIGPAFHARKPSGSRGFDDSASFCQNSRVDIVFTTHCCKTQF